MTYTDQIQEAAAVRERLRNPSNAVIDEGIDLKRKPKLPSITATSIRDPREDRIKELINRVAEMQLELRELQKPLDPCIRTVEGVIDIVAKRFAVSKIDLKSPRRDHPLTHFRQIAMYLAKTLTMRSLPHIARHFGGRDHTTVLHAVRKIQAKRIADPTLDLQLKEIETAIHLPV